MTCVCAELVCCSSACSRAAQCGARHAQRAAREARARACHVTRRAARTPLPPWPTPIRSTTHFRTLERRPARRPTRSPRGSPSSARTPSPPASRYVRGRAGAAVGAHGGVCRGRVSARACWAAASTGAPGRSLDRRRGGRCVSRKRVFLAGASCACACVHAYLLCCSCLFVSRDFFLRRCAFAVDVGWRAECVPHQLCLTARLFPTLCRNLARPPPRR